MPEKWNVIGLGGRGLNALNNLNLSEGGVFQGAVRSYIIGYDEKNSVFSGKWHIKPRKVFSNKIKGHAGDVITPETIKDSLSQAPHSLLIAGLGGNTEGKAMSALAGVLGGVSGKVVCAVSYPFIFEGPERQAKAVEAYNELKKHDVKIVLFKNQNLFDVAEERTTFSDAFLLADRALNELINNHANDDLGNVPKYAQWNFTTGNLDIAS